jgi:pimeloyl-ACP methyl ester carboxylesterase
LCNALVGETSEKLWDFWACLKRGGGDGGDSAGAPNSNSEVAGSIPGGGGGGAMHVVRYAARGHGESSAGAVPADCTWEALGRDMLQLGQRLRRGPEQKMVLGGASMG